MPNTNNLRLCAIFVKMNGKGLTIVGDASLVSWSLTRARRAPIHQVMPPWPDAKTSQRRYLLPPVGWHRKAGAGAIE
jgi:hypothetical protein